jgi:hypothetical protein
MRRSTVAPNGKTYEWWEYDASFRPPTPAGAVPGDPSKQIFCAAHDVPRFFYIDERRVCVDCGAEFVFTASEQRYWYEALKFNFGSVAIRCRGCRKRRRQTRALNNQIAAARAALTREPNSPTPHLDLAEGLVALHQQTGDGNLDDAIAAARKARALWPAGAEADYWEAKAHALAGRRTRARTLLQTFLAHPASPQLRRGTLARDAGGVLQELTDVDDR